MTPSPGRVTVRHRRGLGHAVALVQVEAEAAEGLHRLGRQRRAAADQQPHPGAELLVHRVERDLAQAGAQLVAQRAVAVDDRLERALEQDALVRDVL
jgi:hypothetical protein